MKKILYLLIALIVLMSCNASAFDFYGYTYDINGTPLDSTNISMEIYLQGGGGPPTLITTFNATSSGTGWFNVSGITGNDSYSYKPVVRHYNSTTGDADYVSQSLPDLPYEEVSGTSLENMTFYLREGGTINITAKGEQESLGIVNETAHYNVTDYNLGLEWDNDTNRWAYLNASNNLILLTSAFAANESYNISMAGVVDFEYVYPNQWYFLNSTTVWQYVENVTNGSLALNATFALNCSSDCNFDAVGGIEEYNNTFYITAYNNSETSIQVFSPNFTRQDDFVIDEAPPGKIEREGDLWYIAGNSSAQYRIYECEEDFSCEWDSRWNVSSSVEGLEYNGSAWFYGSATSSNITEFELGYDDGTKNFRYMVKDRKLGYPIAENFDSEAASALVYLPADRNYSIMLYPDNSFPISYDVNNLSDYTGNHADIRFNTSEQWRRVSGNMNLSNGTTGFDSITIINFIYEVGMISQDHPMPYNLSAWSGSSDIYSATTGFYNITLPGSAMTAKIMMFALASKGSSYYGAFRNISLDYSNASVTNWDFNLTELLGAETNITLDKATQNDMQNITFTLKKVVFQLQNASGSAINSSSAFTETEVDYTSLPDGATFKWMQDISASDSGILRLILLSSVGVEKMNIYSQQFAPKKISFTSSQLTGTVGINLSSNNDMGKGIGNESFSDLFIDMIKSNAACDVPNYNKSACSLFPQGQDMNMSEFNPFKIVLGGGKISFVMRKDSNNITVHYKNVDMLASGPPDALFDDSANESEAGSNLEMAWRFGSMGPEIYDEVLIGIPLGSNVDYAAPVSILIENLYDENWNAVWNVNMNGTPNASSDLPTDYSTFNLTWFNKTVNGMPCSESDTSAQCYVNNVSGMAWITIPHFSGIGPAVQSVSSGNVTVAADAAIYNCTGSCLVYFNVTNQNYTVAQSLYNITISTLDVNNNIANISIYWYNNSVGDFELHDSFVGNGTNSTNQSDYNLTRYNGSTDTLHRYRLNITKSANQGTSLNITYNITDLFALSLSLSFSCVEDWSYSAWTTCSGSIQTRTATDGNACGTTNDRASLSQSCVVASSGGGGGGGGASSNPTTSQVWDKVTPGVAYIMKVSNDDFGIKEIHIELNKESNNVKIMVEKHPGKPATITKEFTGNVYRYLEIKKFNFADADFKGNVMIKFQVSRGWLLNNKMDPEGVVLLRFNNDKWEELKTKLLKTDDKYAYYEGETPGFSYFLIGEKGALDEEVAEEEATTTVAEEEATEEEVVVVEPEPEPEPAVEEQDGEEGKTSPLAIVLVILAVVLLVAILIFTFVSRKRKKDRLVAEFDRDQESHKGEHEHTHHKHHK